MPKQEDTQVMCNLGEEMQKSTVLFEPSSTLTLIPISDGQFVATLVGTLLLAATV